LAATAAKSRAQASCEREHRAHGSTLRETAPPSMLWGVCGACVAAALARVVHGKGK
jgi:hypothetical protein